MKSMSMSQVTKVVVTSLVCLCLAVVLLGTFPDQASAKGKPASPPGQVKKGEVVIQLHDVDSHLTSPTGRFRWLNVADQAYSEWYQNNYNYTQATVEVTYQTRENVLCGTLTAENLKPDFAYQLKLVGKPEVAPAGNERIGLAGRWWQEEWNGSEWANGHNLNNKGDGSSPNPNDGVYFATRDVADDTSPTGLKYRYTGYLVLDYFITDDQGNAVVNFQTDSSYHVLWKTSQRIPTAEDGPLKASTFDPDPFSVAYDVDYGASTVTIFGEWERLPVGGVYLEPGKYRCQMLLTEESFHGSGGELAGNWAAAMAGDLSFGLKVRRH